MYIDVIVYNSDSMMYSSLDATNEPSLSTLWLQPFIVQLVHTTQRVTHAEV